MVVICILESLPKYPSYVGMFEGKNYRSFALIFSEILFMKQRGFQLVWLVHWWCKLVCEPALGILHPQIRTFSHTEIDYTKHQPTEPTNQCLIVGWRNRSTEISNLTLECNVFFLWHIKCRYRTWWNQMTHDRNSHRSQTHGIFETALRSRSSRAPLFFWGRLTEEAALGQCVFRRSLVCLPNWNMSYDLILTGMSCQYLVTGL